MSFLLASSAVRVAAAALGLAVVIGGAASLLSGPPEAVAPSRGALSPANISLAEPSLDTGNDFVARPLFWVSRRPLEPIPVVDTAAEADREATPVETSNASALDKVKLRGTFASGSEVGVIVNFDGQRMRMVTGDSLEGWSLVGVEEGGAVFEGVVYQGRPAERRTVALEHVYPQSTRAAGGAVTAAELREAAVVRNGSGANGARPEPVKASDPTVRMLGGSAKARANKNKGER